ncbi:MAG: DUF4199 domain-containing protein [Robiginitalea sp.]|uniref:DUF4199 domain-containing protein n=1 Tax=Robiginitalea sp. TaxID=1902411 RepID=UPI003C713B3C
METSTPKIGKFSLNYGLILGGLGVVFALMLFMSDAHVSQSPVNSIISIVMSIGVIFWGILNFRKANGGLLKLGQAVKLGAGIALVSGIISVIWMLLLTNVLDPDFISKSIDMQLATVAEEGTLTTEQLEQQREISNQYWAAFAYPSILIGSILIGLLIGLVGGLIFKKAAPDY